MCPAQYPVQLNQPIVVWCSKHQQVPFLSVRDKQTRVQEAMVLSRSAGTMSMVAMVDHRNLYGAPVYFSSELMLLLLNVLSLTQPARTQTQLLVPLVILQNTPVTLVVRLPEFDPTTKHFD